MSSKKLEICCEKKYISPPIIDRASITEIKLASVFGNLALCSKKFVTGSNSIDNKMEKINGTTTVWPSTTKTHNNSNINNLKVNCI